MKIRGDRRRRATLGPQDAWVLARIMADQPITGEVAAMSERWRGLAERLLETAPERRPGILEGYSLSLPDPDELLDGIGDARPAHPPPIEEQRAWERAGAGPAIEARLVRASAIEPQRVDWLWADRVPMGMLTLFSGDPKLGKSLATLSLIAAVTGGRPLPGGSTLPSGSAILLSAEDDPARTIWPRLKAAGAALERVQLLATMVEEQYEGPAGDPAATIVQVERMPTLIRCDLEAIERSAGSLGDCRLIVIDPVSAYLGDCDDHRNTNLRGVLTPLKEMAERLGAAVVLVTHHNKNSAMGANGKYRVLGSIAYVGACRANFLFHKDPDDPEGHRVLVLDNGGNLAPKQPGLAYLIRDAGEGPFCDWQPGTIDLDADAVLARAAKASKSRESDGRSERRMACEDWLRDFLDRGTKRVADCIAEGQKQGFHPKAVQRARERVGARVTRVGFGEQSEYYWSLEDEDSDREDDQSRFDFGRG